MATVTHPLVFRNNHLFVQINGALWVYDTGADSSFGIHPVSLIGPVREISTDYAGFTAADISGFLGETVAGIIGADLINPFDHIIDLRTNTLTVSDEQLTCDGHVQKLDFFMGVPMLEAQIGGARCKLFFDTGAQISYYQGSVPHNAEPAGRLDDFFPTIGKFTTDTHRFPVALSGFSPVVRFGKLPGLMGMSLGMAGVSGILGNELMRNRVTGYFPRRQQLILATVSANDNHRSWAKHYNQVNRMCFGRFYDELTRQTLAQINTLGSNLRIADFGAGTGRLSLPLASAGHSVTAIEPSQAMLEQLAAKDTAGQISKHNSTMAGYAGPGGHDLAIAVFTVIAYITTEQELVDSFRKVAQTLKPSGAFLLDVPRLVLFSHNYVDQDGLVRDITFTQTSPNHYTYQEKTRLDTADGVFTYEDTFPLRYWTTTEVEKALHEAGLKRTKDWSHHFPMAGAEYWLCSREVEVSYSSRAVTV